MIVHKHAKKNVSFYGELSKDFWIEPSRNLLSCKINAQCILHTVLHVFLNLSWYCDQKNVLCSIPKTFILIIM